MVKRELEAWVAPSTWILKPMEEFFPRFIPRKIHGGPYTNVWPLILSSEKCNVMPARRLCSQFWSNPARLNRVWWRFALKIDLAYPGNDYHDLMKCFVDELVARKYAESPKNA